MKSPLDGGRLRRRVISGEPTVGTFLGTASAIVAEVCAAAGVDWLVLDLEHGSGGEEQVRAVVPAAGAYGVPTRRPRCGHLQPRRPLRARPGRARPAADEVLGVVQIESGRALEEVDKIAAIDGVDVLFVGPRDLSHDLGVPGDLTSPAYLAALGWTFVTIASDSALLAGALRSELHRSRST
jgi:4-hydroxy-2-oxoheptanedioate aldolase